MLEFDREYEPIPEGAEALLSRVAERTCAREGVTGVSACLHFVGDERIHEINAATRGVDRATDVLSFPTVNYPAGKYAADCPKLLRREVDPETGLAFLGDVFLSIPRAKEQAEAFGHSLSREMGYLTAHAMLHLMGYDHETDAERAVMREKEEAVMSETGLTRPGVTDEKLFRRACDMLPFSYSPYSHFRVGAALLCGDGRVFTGCNIENASLGATICAERTAAVKAVSEGAREFVAVAIASDHAYAWPCGICRQFLNEFSRDLVVICGPADGSAPVRTLPLKTLLPESFGPEDLA